MYIDELIKRRRSVFPAQFSGDKLPDSEINRLLENANWAPTHIHTEPWRFIVFKDESLKELMLFMAELYKAITPIEHYSTAKYQKFATRADNVSHVIAIGMHRHDLPGLPEEEEIAAVAMAVQNLWLTLADIPKAGGYWSSGPLVYTPQFAEYLGWKSPIRCLGLFYIGMVDESKPHAEGHRKPIAEKVVWR
jgi:nitroreductase